MRELNQRTSAVLQRVREGASVVITDRGVPVARVVPFRPSPYEQLVAEGEYVPATTDELHVPPPSQPGTRASAEVLDELRSERTRRRSTS